MNALRDRHRSYMSSARKRFASERNIKNIGGKHCQTLIQVKFTRAYLAVEESSRRFGTAGDLVTPRRPWKEDRAIPWRRQSCAGLPM